MTSESKNNKQQCERYSEDDNRDGINVKVENGVNKLP